MSAFAAVLIAGFHFLFRRFPIFLLALSLGMVSCTKDSEEGGGPGQGKKFGMGKRRFAGGEGAAGGPGGAPQSPGPGGRFRYENKEQFRNFMQGRLDTISKAITALKAKSGGKPNADELKNLEQKRASLEAKLKEIDGVQREDWRRYKLSVREEIIALEKSYQSMVATAR